MPDIATALKSEIARIARKEIRAELAALKKAAAQHRTHITALHRSIDGLERSVKSAANANAKSTNAASRRRAALDSDDEQQPLRFRADGLANHRKRLGLSAADFGKLLGVSGQSIYKWESGEVRPRRAQLEAIAAIRTMGKREALARLEQQAS